MFLRSCCFLVFCLLSISVMAMPPKLEIIVNEVMSHDGKLTSELHERFWNKVDETVDPDEVDQIKATMDVNFKLGLEYQKELWESARHSYEREEVYKSSRLEELEEEIPLRFRESLTWQSGTTEYNNAVRSHSQGMRVSLENSKRLLISASERRFMVSTQGEVVHLDQDVFDLVIDGLNGSFSRLKSLLNRNWVE